MVRGQKATMIRFVWAPKHSDDPWHDVWVMFYAFLFNRFDRANVHLLAEREIRARIVGTYLGLGHYVLLPILMLLVYSFVFSIIFSVRWTGADNTFGSFAMRVFIGLIAFQFFSEVVNRAPGLVLENPTYVKKVVFPLETLVPTAILIALFSAAIMFAVFMVAYVWIYGFPPLTALWTAVLWPPLILLTSGLAWGLASLGVFLRDLRQLVSILTSVLIFITPVFYPLSMVPPPYDTLVASNPLSYLIEMMRVAVFDGRGPDLLILAGYYLGGLAFAQLGYWVFMRTKKAFADVI
jgi:lipopolysaccharide transport system permease protein